jgi:peptide/nickel transport system substrate-binding protein
MRFNRTSLGIAVVIVVLIASACGTPERESDAEATSTPVRGGTLIAALTTEPAHLNPAITTAGEIHAASEVLYNGLLELNEKGEPEPDLAASLPTIEQDGAVFRFTLRDGVKWHDGQPFSSADVKFTFEEVLLKLHPRTSASMRPAFEGIETPDDRTVIFRFKQPYAPFLQQLDVTESPIIPKHLYEGSDPLTNPANIQPVGTGAFKFVSFAKGSEIRYERNPDYFKKDLPYLDELVMKIIPDPSARVLSLENGDVDWIADTPGVDLARLEQNEEITTAETNWNPGGSNCIMTITFNLDRPAFKDLRFRQAFASGLDRQQFVDQILFGQGRVADAPISSGIPWAHANRLDMPGFDRAKAESLLDEAGWKMEGEGARVARGVEGVPDGTRLSFGFLHFPTFVKYGELVRSQLAAIGIDVLQEPLDPAPFRERVFVRDDFDTAIISYCNGPDPEVGVRRMFHSSEIGAVPFTNASHFSDPQVDSLFNEAAREVDRTRRTPLYRQIQEIAVANMPYVWVVETTAVRSYSASCDGFKFHNGLFAEAASCEKT